MVDTAPKAPVSKGLRDIVVAESSICLIDGKAGRLSYRGYDIHDLAQQSTFEEVAYLLWFGQLPDRLQLGHSSHDMATSRRLPEAIRATIQSLPFSTNAMDVLRTAVSLMGHYDEEVGDTTPEANMHKCNRLTGEIASAIAAYQRIRQRLPIVAPREDFDHATNFLYMLTGEEPDPISARALDMYLVLLAEHSFNASTFAARVTAATLSDLHSAITSAVGTLKGPLHGGANEAAMHTILQIGDPSRTRDYVHRALEAKQRFMGFGHAVYKTMDPRATELKAMARELSEAKGDTRYYEITEELEQIVLAEKGLYPNVDLYSATVLYQVGIPIDLFTPLFAVARIVGWTAHVLEQWADNRLIRPDADYVGPLDLTYIPLDQRA
jgi:citrate synthase